MAESSNSSFDPVEFLKDATQLSQAERHKMRSKLSEDVEAFLNQGGKVVSVADNERADPPKKPAMNYGSAPI
ncbi:MAG: hypothetical protein H6999_12165 [Hahellaceae bacterium]|nr:hypothetical protein [Hahellaceae bacterium]MCP5170497.1 hypothetical protein [Hahellaceae bacterium]